MILMRMLSCSILIFALLVLPGCFGRKESKATSPTKKPCLETSLDLPLAIQDEKLSRIGLSSEVGEHIALQEQKNVDETQFNAAPIEEKPVEVAASQDKAPADEKTKAEPIFDEAEEPSIEFHFENADLEVLTNQIAELFDVTFITDDAINPMPQGGKSLKKILISFKTHQPLTKREAWNLFITFLEIAGLSVVAEPNPRIKRIVTLDLAKKSPLPAFVGVSPELLPNSDEMIRYVYFVENADLNMIFPIVNQLRSTSSGLQPLPEMKAFLLTDKAYNIKSLMNVVKELDKVTMPQAMSVLKLRRADAEEVANLYKTLAGTTEKDTQQRMFTGKRTSPATYFPDNVSIFAEKRTNSLILLGPQDAIKRIEDFITQSVDVDLTQPYSPLQVVPLKYANADTVAKIMNDVAAFGMGTEAGKSGGVRNGDKYMRPITFIAERETNRLIIKGDYEDVLKAREVIAKLDEPQPQVAIEVLLLAVSLNENKQLGSVIRSRVPGSEGLMGNNAVFQTTGLFGTQAAVENPNGNGVNRLLGNLLNLVSQGVSVGNTIVSLGDSLSTWAIIQALETLSNVQVLANPFLIATNKTKAQVSLGEIRRVTTGTIIGSGTTTNTVGDAPAELKVLITPQINSDGMIVLDIEVSLSQFVGAANPDAAVRTDRKIKTKTIVTNKEVLALGGLVQNSIDSTQTKVPVLGDIPVLGWLFKNKQNMNNKSNLLILISSRIIEPESMQTATAFTDDHITDYTDTINEMRHPAEKRDPINRWFFDQRSINDVATDEFIFKRQRESIIEEQLDKDVVVPIAQNDKRRPSKKEIRA
jgi:general secretion pathway protein D